MEKWSNCRIPWHDPAAVVLNCTAHLFLKNNTCAGINYWQWKSILQWSRKSFHFKNKFALQAKWVGTMKTTYKGYLKRFNFGFEILRPWKGLVNWKVLCLGLKKGLVMSFIVHIECLKENIQNCMEKHMSSHLKVSNLVVLWHSNLSLNCVSNILVCIGLKYFLWGFLCDFKRP